MRRVYLRTQPRFLYAQGVFTNATSILYALGVFTNATSMRTCIYERNLGLSNREITADDALIPDSVRVFVPLPAHQLNINRYVDIEFNR